MSAQRVLAIETSTDACSVALQVDGRRASRELIEPRAHAGALMPMIDEVLGELDVAINALDGIAYGRGPGSFTGLRIAIALAQGLALGAALPVLGVSSLRLVAQQALDANDEKQVLILQDARMEEVYAGVYRPDGAGLATAVTADALLPADRLALHEATLIVGNAPQTNRAVGRWVSARQTARYSEAHALPFATTLLRLALAATSEQWRPASEASAVYLRNTVASVPGA